MQKGQSIIEVIIALALFVIIAGSSIVAIVGALSTTRLAEEETLATLYASEGVEAVQSIRNQSWSNIINGTYGLSNSGGTWTLSGTSDDPNGSGTYTRIITISDVQRDGNGDIVSSGGTVDLETKQVDTNISWDFTPTRNNSVNMVSYLTNWQLSKNASDSAIPSPTSTPTPTATPTPTPTPPASCNDYCIAQSYSGGTCRKNPAACNQNSESHQSGGDTFCTGGQNYDTCCCAP